MTAIKDLSSTCYAPELHEGVNAKSVGWLGATVPTKGEMPDDLRPALEHFNADHFVLEGELGSHECEICGREEGYGQFWVETESVRYVLPRLFFHYVDDHGYIPPAEFLDDLRLHWSSVAAEECRSGACHEKNRERSGLEHFDR